MRNEEMNDEQKIKRTAFHEAGHAVVNILMGRKVKQVTIEPGGDELGSVSLKDKLGRPRGGHKDSREYIRNLLCGCSAGHAAEAKILKKMGVPENPDNYISQQDWDRIADVAMEWADYQEFIEEAYDLAVELVNKNWDTISILAERLLIERTMDGKEVESFLADRLKGADDEN